MPPEPAVPGLVTVTGTIPGVAMAVAGIGAVSWPAVIRVVVCIAPFQLMTAFVAKLLPLTVKVNWGSPEFAVLGTSCATAGVTPGCGPIALGELYPHPRHTIVSNNTEIVFINLLPIEGFYWQVSKGQGGRCQAGVTFLSRICLPAQDPGNLPTPASSWGTLVLKDLARSGAVAASTHAHHARCFAWLGMTPART